jgi:hypothetical protein
MSSFDSTVIKFFLQNYISINDSIRRELQTKSILDKID